MHDHEKIWQRDVPHDVSQGPVAMEDAAALAEPVGEQEVAPVPVPVSVSVSVSVGKTGWMAKSFQRYIVVPIACSHRPNPRIPKVAYTEGRQPVKSHEVYSVRLYAGLVSSSPGASFPPLVSVYPLPPLYAAIGTLTRPNSAIAKAEEARGQPALSFGSWLEGCVRELQKW